MINNIDRRQFVQRLGMGTMGLIVFTSLATYKLTILMCLFSSVAFVCVYSNQFFAAELLPIQ